MMPPCLKVCLTAALVLGAAALPAQARSLVSRTPSIGVTVPAGETQAQLASQLQADGYTDIRLSAVPATPSNPTPQNNPLQTAHPERTLVRSGWNGVATRGAQQLQVYASLQ